MSNETNPDLRISTNNLNLEFSGEDNSPGLQSPRVEAKQEKPKRKYNKRKQQESPTEPSGVGSTVHQARRQRNRARRHKQELADKFGLVTEGFTNTRSVPKPRKPRKPAGENKPRKDDRKEKDKLKFESESESSSDSESEMEYETMDLRDFMRGVFPMLRPRVSPVDTVLNKVTSAFMGCPVIAHVSETKPGNTKLTIEIEL